MPRGAPSKSSFSGGWPQRILRTAFWPPMVLHEPWSTLTVVTPPAELPVDVDVVVVDHVGDPHLGGDAVRALVHVALDRGVRVGVDECRASRSGPRASSRVAPAGTATSAPTAAILPPWIRMVPFSIVPCGPTVSRVPPTRARGASLAGASGRERSGPGGGRLWLGRLRLRRLVGVLLRLGLVLGLVERAVDEDHLHLRVLGQRLAAPGHDVRDLARLEAAQSGRPRPAPRPPAG